MPRAFTDQEKAIIRERLLEQGRAFLTSYGVRRTSVEDLTRAAGISKGAFYAFFSSKEELFFTVFEQFEAAYRQELLSMAQRAEGPPREHLRAFLRHAITRWRASPLFTRMGREEYDIVARKLPPERLRAHLEDDEAFVARLIDQWRAAGVEVASSPAELTGLIRALFFISLHAEEFGSASYDATIALLIELIADHLLRPAA